MAGGHLTSGTMSFNAHSPMPAPSFGFGPLSEDSITAKQIATLQAKLDKKLGPEYVSQRPGPGGGPKLTYAEGWKIINLANEVFGFNGWSSSIVSVATDFVDYNDESKRFNVGVTAIVRVTLRDGTYHEDVGYGMLENSKSKAGALDKCKKEAITDALKRTLRNFGNLLGNCLYDKSYAQEVVKIKVPPVKFDKNELYRRPEFRECVPDTPQPANAETASNHGEPRIKAEQDARPPETPITYVPRHLRQEVAAQHSRVQVDTPPRTPAAPHQKMPTHPQAHASTSAPGSSTISTPKTMGLATSIQTPMSIRRPPPPRAPPPPVVATSPLAQSRNSSEKSVSFSEPVSAEHDMDHGGQGCGDEDDDDSFPLSTQDGEFFAMVDLGDGDLGRPIDFEEGTVGASNLHGSVLGLEVESADQPAAVQPPSRFQVRERARSGSNTGPLSGVPVKTNEQKGAQPFVTPTASTSNPVLNSNAKANGGQPQPSSGAPNATSSSSASSTNAGSSAPDVKRFRPGTTSMGGFHFPAAGTQKQPDQQNLTHTLKPATSFARSMSATPQSGPSNVLKRTADEMMSHKVPSSSTRPQPIQGMGLAQREQQNASARRPSEHGEGGDPKRAKR